MIINRNMPDLAYNKRIMVGENSSEPPKSIYDVPMDLPGDKPPKRPLSKKKLVQIIIGIIVLALLALVGAKLFGSKADQKATEGTTETKPEFKDVEQAAGTTPYENDQIGIKLLHPESWQVSDSSSGVLLKSGDFNYQTASEEEINGHFRVYIRLGAREADRKYIGRGYTIKPSEKIKYNNPLVGQRKTTFLSSFGPEKSNNFSFFLIAGNFNLKKNETLGPNYGKETDAFIVVGGYSSDELKDEIATNVVPFDVYDQTNAYKQAVEIVKSLQLR